MDIWVFKNLRKFGFHGSRKFIVSIEKYDTLYLGSFCTSTYIEGVYFTQDLKVL